MQARLFNNAQALTQNNCQKTCKTTFYILYLRHQSARIGRSRYLHYKKDGRSPRKGAPNFFLVLGFIGLLDLLVKIIDKIGVVRPQGGLLNSLSNNKKSEKLSFLASVPPQVVPIALPD